MNILVIKQTSLGDVLHASGHIRAIKQAFPESRLTLLTATTSEEIYRYSPWVDELILIDRYGVKANWKKNPRWAFAEMVRVWKEVREQTFDLAFDLQGLAKSVIFLYAARARKKFVKGSWLGMKGYRNKKDHALEEMKGVLKLAGIDVSDVSMEFQVGQSEKQAVDTYLEQTNPEHQPFVVMSPFSRWVSKDWPLANFMEVARRLESRHPEKLKIYCTGAPEKQQEVELALEKSALNATLSAIGHLTMLEFVELVSRSKIMITSDSFPMHVSVARDIPVVALFGPTNESLVGPRGEQHQVIRAPDCRMCDRSNCPSHCVSKISVDDVVIAVEKYLE